MDLNKWSLNELRLAIKHEKEAAEKEGKPDNAEYGIECYKSAYKAFRSLVSDNHSGYSISLTKQILNRLIDGLPLTPIEDTEDEWKFLYDHNNRYGESYEKYQCKRMSSLFKNVCEDGSIKYFDINRFCCVDIDKPDVIFGSGFINIVMDEMFPIIMPYFPESKSYYVYLENFVSKIPKQDDVDIMRILYLIKPNGEHVDINRYFKGTGTGFTEISSSEYEMLKQYRKREDDNS